ncbi:MAG: hypothetical protein V4546_05365 [Bacteroidota bacterium]
MPNWCNNIVQFTGEPQKLEELNQLFEAMAVREKETHEAQLPSFVKAEQGYLFDTYLDSGTLYYDTRWSPNTDIIVQIADHYQVDFLHQYSELAMGVFGEATYEAGVLKETYLDFEDLNQYEYDEEKDCYTFEGNLFESDMEILETLLERKKEQQGNPPGLKR